MLSVRSYSTSILLDIFNIKDGALQSIHKDGISLRIQVGRTRPLEDNVSTMLAQVSLELDTPASKFRSSNYGKSTSHSLEELTEVKIEIFCVKYISVNNWLVVRDMQKHWRSNTNTKISQGDSE